MNGMIFKSILIADIQTHTAKIVNFENGINIITSTENHVGKSSLIKSLYYCLGAEVDYDNSWDKKSKIYIANILIGDIEYRIIHQGKKYAVLQNGALVLLTDSVSKDLANYLSSILNFSVYLPNKDTGKNELAPPVFTYLPYYIDQDKGWGTEPYESFNSLEQYKKKDRKTSLYYHLNVYNKWSIDVLAEIDKNKENIDVKDCKITELKATLSTLLEESAYIIDAEDINELDISLSLPKEKISQIVENISVSRDRLQKLESQLLQYKQQLVIVKEYNKIKIKDKQKVKKPDNIAACPKCGYILEQEIYNLVREQYSIENEEFMIQQIQLLIDDTNKKLELEKNKYLKFAEELKLEENRATIVEDKFEQYVKHKGLAGTVKSIQNQIGELMLQKDELTEKNKQLRKQLKDLTDKKEIDGKYSEFLRSNLIALGAWDSKYEKKLKILDSLKGQGTLSNKIILAQYISLFMTMQSTLTNSIIKLPFVVDSPRGKEPSKTSSEDILNLILNIKMLPQVILATMDFDDFDYAEKSNINIIRLSEQRALLNSEDYKVNENEIKDCFDLLQSLS